MVRDEISIKIRLKLKMQLGDIAYYISETKDLRNKIYSKEEKDGDFEETLNDELNLNLDLSSILPLTIEKNADEIENLKNQESSSETLDLQVLKRVLNL